LHHGVAQVAVGVAIGEIRGGAQLLGSDAAAENVGANVGEAGLLLRMNADVVALDVGGYFFRLGGVEGESDTVLEGS
jgi:hypothetical protein